MASVDNPTIPADCASFPAPTVLFADCASSADIGRGGFGWVVFSKQPFAAAPSLTEVTTRLAANDDTKMIVFKLSEGGMPAVDAPELQYGNDTISAGPADRTIDVTILETNSTNVEFARLTQAGGGYSGHWWPVTLDGKYMRGGQNGINGRLKLNSVIPTGRDDARTLTGQIRFRSQFEPKQGANVFPLGPDED
ncbi:hypothetical protein LJ737_20695 [Hymenobacter sp. 15J16-1T3B]|uniref:hypothetical protein n=1 Tax=Hymenobacter sp. 15J16-1T3B TaxID=2886941 RepID=UPI001D10E516|nr:hypothetical protein [Hymenobacter sp. 15J16-1T3B]MCC3159672.1 hypothetical protein [Hymenobacter sp. 15J16-1T3B]